MKTVTKTIAELIDSNESPLSLEVIPNHMGINLCSVEAVTWTKRDDGQLAHLMIHFIPSESLISGDEFAKEMEQHQVNPKIEQACEKLH